MKNNDKENNKKFLYTALTAIAITTLAIIIVLSTFINKKDDKTLSYTELIKQISINNQSNSQLLCLSYFLLLRYSSII